MNRLKEVREEKKMTMVRLAELSGISRQRIAQIESDPEANVHTDTLQKLADALGVGFDEIFFALPVNK